MRHVEQSIAAGIDCPAFALVSPPLHHVLLLLLSNAVKINDIHDKVLRHAMIPQEELHMVVGGRRKSFDSN